MCSVSAFYNVFVCFPFATEEEDKPYYQRRETGNGIAKPESEIFHAEAESQQQGKAYTHDYGVTNGIYYIYEIIH